MPRAWLATDKETVDFLNNHGEDAWLFSDVDNAQIDDCEVIVVGRGADAKAKALELLSRGVPDIRLSYVDMNKGDDPAKRLGKPKHLHWDDVCTLDELPPARDFDTYPTGLEVLDRNLGWRWRIPELVVMAGAYASGKSTVLQMLAAGWANGTGRQVGGGAMLCSWEDAADEVKRNMTAFGNANDAPDLCKRVSFVRRHPDDDRLIAWYMDLVRYHKERYGTRFFVLDPWNEMDHVKDARLSETDYVRDMMKAFRRLVDKLQIILVIATHVPAKVIKGDGSVEPFKLAQAFGSVQFANKADRGICIVRTKKYQKPHGHTIIRLDKSKVERLMGRRGTLAVELDEDNFRFVFDPRITTEVREIWKD